jgi:hypothetical protein
MKKLYLLVITGVIFRMEASAQAFLGQSANGKMVQAAAAIRLPFNTGQVETAVKAWLSQKGYGSSNTHGFILSRGVLLATGDRDGSDLYFSTSAPDRKVKDMSLLTLVPAKKNQPIAAGSFVDSSKLDDARLFLDSLAGFVSTYTIGIQVGNQQESLRKAQKKLGQLRNDSTDDETRIRNLQSDLAQNKADQVKASADLQTYIGADSDKKQKYQKRLNKLLDKQGNLEKKIRNTQSDLADTKADITNQQSAIDQLQHTLDTVKGRQP